MTEEILNIEYDNDEGKLTVDCDDSYKAILAITAGVLHQFKNGDRTIINFLFGLMLHVLAAETSGVLQKAFLENINKNIEEYRKEYQQMVLFANTTMKQEQ